MIKDDRTKIPMLGMCKGTKCAMEQKLFMKVFVAHYGIEWPCMALCGLVWLYVVFYGLLPLFYLIWGPMVLYGLLW